jgi:uncharacterized protein
MEQNRPEIITQDGTPVRKTLGLLLTRKCNLDCTYCYVHSKADMTMSFEVAQKAVIEAFTEDTTSYDELEIDFMGGEPLCAFPELKAISEWIWSYPWDKPYILFATTNGTLLNEEMKEWFTENKRRFVLGLSYDGEIMAHDINRSKSFHSIDVKYFLETWPEQPFKMTISEDTVEYLAENIIHLQERNIRFLVSYALGMPNWSNAKRLEYSKQLKLLLDYYLNHPEIVPCNLFDLNLSRIADGASPTEERYCGAGKYFYVVDYDGSRSPCHLLSELALTKEQKEAADQLDLWNRENFEIQGCTNCLLSNVCPMCHGMSFLRSGNAFHREVNVCHLFKIQVLANCKLKASLLSKQNVMDHSKEEMKTAFAIKQIMSLIA